MTRARAAWVILLSGIGLTFSCVGLAFTFSLTYRPPRPVDSPKVTDWMQGWGSLAGVIAALLAAGAAGALLRHEIAASRRAEDQARIDRLAEQEKLRRAPAEAITYYLESGSSNKGAVRTPVDWAEGNESIPKGAYESGALVIHNNSTSCIYRVIASAPDLPKGLDLRGIGVIPPGITRIVLPMKHMMDGGSTAGRHMGDYANNTLIPWIQFRDSAGTSWRRTNHGAVEEVFDPIQFPNYSY
jgi:hypothetical protein